MALGFQSAGFQPVVAFDNDRASVDTYRRNIDANVMLADARFISGAWLLERAGMSVGEVDVVSGGPPCQGFSLQRRGGERGDDPLNDLVFEFARLVRDIRPAFFIFENVKAVAGKRGTAVLAFLTDHLCPRGYDLTSSIYLATDHNVAQRRQRMIVVGQCRGEPFLRPPTWWELGEEDRTTVRAAIGDLPSPPMDGTDHPDFPNHARTRITALNELRFSHVPPGGGWRDIPIELMLPCHRRALGGDVTRGLWPDVYGRLEWDDSAPTITAGFDSFTRGRYGHPEENRAITPREAARLQGFPDSFVFLGNRTEVRTQLGNAVPPPLAAAIGRSILVSLGACVG